MAGHSAVPKNIDAPVVWPADAVKVASVVGAWGVKGWLRLRAYSPEPTALFSTRCWYFRGNSLDADLAMEVTGAKVHGTDIVAGLSGISDRTLAEQMKGADVFLPRSSFPRTQEGEYYWIDLIGLRVVNRDGAVLGRVVGLLETGAQCVLRVQSERQGKTSARRDDCMIPFVSRYIDDVSLQGNTISVDWELDY